YQHDFNVSGTAADFTFLPVAPYSVPSKRWSAFIQDQWRVIPTLTINARVRYGTQQDFGQCPPGSSCGIVTPAPPRPNFEAFSLTNQWAPRVGFVWDWAGDGTSKLYGSVGRFFYAIPTDLNVRVYTANSAISSYNYDPNSLDQFAGPLCTADGQHGCIA